MNFDLLYGELALALAVARELSSEDGKANLKLVEVSAGHLNEDVLRVEGDLGCLTVDDGRKREHLAGSIVEDGIAWLILDDVEILLKLLVILKNLEELNCVQGLCLLESAEDDVLWSSSLIGDRSMDLIIVVGAHRAESPSAADILMKLVLQVNEGVVRLRVKLDIA